MPRLLEHSPPRYRMPWHRQVQQIPRWLRVLVLAATLTLVLLGLLQGLSIVHDQHIKLYATDFARLHGRLLWSPRCPVRQLRGDAIDDQYLFLRALGHGQEGHTVLYTDLADGQTVVVKSFTSTARNKLPAELAADFANYTTTWPSEIEAGLILGDMAMSSSFLPVLDYFILEAGDTWVWSLVSPFIIHGTLDRLSRHEEESRFASPDQLHATYYLAFANLLEGLASLHEAGMCHDDVKTDNVFIRAPDHWVLGDLGNLRHSSHAWHRTRSWIRQNQWADCELNDVKRSLKTYLHFLRKASANTADFDRQFWEGKTMWSRHYWSFLQNVRDGRSVTALEMAREVAADGLKTTISDRPTASSLDRTLADRTERELICTSIPRRLWKWWWWLGITSS